MPGHMTPIKIAGAGTVSVTSNSVVQIDIPEDGEILAISGFVDGSGMDALNDKAVAELSFLSTNQIEVNDARGSILETAVRVAGNTGGFAKGSEHVTLSFTPGSGIPVSAGERIHMHTFGSTGVTPNGNFMLYLSAGGAKRARRRR